MNKFLLGVIIYSVLIIGGIVVFLSFHSEKEVGIEKGKENIKQLHALLNKESQAENKKNEAGYQHNDKFVKLFQNVGDTLSFFVAALKEEKEDDFTSFFLPQQYSDDMWAVSKDPYKDKVNYTFMRELNRNGTLVSAKYKTSYMDGYKTKRQDSQVKLILIYKDGKEAQLNLNLVLMGTEHNRNDEVYYIKNSVREMIKEVKDQTKTTGSPS